MGIRQKDKPTANPSIVLREEFDDWAILFDPDSGDTLGLNPIGVFVWRHLDGAHKVEDILENLQNNFEAVPDEAKDHLRDFIQGLVERGLAGT